MFYNVFDSHTHSDNSADGNHSLTFICEKAVEKNLSGLCVTDHCELREYVQGNYERRIAQSVFEAGKARRIFKGRIAVMAGVEISDVLYDPALTDKVLNTFNFDMVLAAHHADQMGRDIHFVDFSEWSPDEISDYLMFYFEYLLRIAQWDGYDSLAHLTYPLRYMLGKYHLAIDIRKYDELIDEILRTVAQNGKALEINTSGLRHPLGETMPSFQYIRRFWELGGEHVTIGSDAHWAEHVGEDIQIGMQLLLDAGFDYFTFYKNRQPMQLKLI